ncbi:hypothetical protein BKA64DRAFT_648271 [Cadophora sp. MPI-SDFR-AT-0126]|nr:hypothetical protein BKA64DRAFT_648271 [Leotiomycetes sp. MPI-SDFR-AT-0126]
MVYLGSSFLSQLIRGINKENGGEHGRCVAPDTKEAASRSSSGIRTEDDAKTDKLTTGDCNKNTPTSIDSRDEDPTKDISLMEKSLASPKKRKLDMQVKADLKRQKVMNAEFLGFGAIKFPPEYSVFGKGRMLCGVDGITEIESKPKAATPGGKKGVGVRRKSKKSKTAFKERKALKRERQFIYVVLPQHPVRIAEIEVNNEEDGIIESSPVETSIEWAKGIFHTDVSNRIASVETWCWKQAAMKALKRKDWRGLAQETAIEGYYVPNESGCARTEGEPTPLATLFTRSRVSIFRLG